MGLNTLKAYAASQRLAHGLKYDYSQIEDEEDRAAVMDAALEIKPRLKRSAEDIVAIGSALIGVKDMLPHGQFMPWLETEFELPYHTARRFMAVAERIGHKIDNLSDLTASVLYELASAPDEVIAQVESRVVAGEAVSLADVKELKAPPLVAAVEDLAERVEAWLEELLGNAPPQDRLDALAYKENVIDWLRDNDVLFRSADLDGVLADMRSRLQAQLRRPLDAKETAAVVGRYLLAAYPSDATRMAALDDLTVEDLAAVVQPGVVIEFDALAVAINRIRQELQGRLAEARAAQREVPADPEREANRLANMDRQRRQMISGHLRMALNHLPEVREDDYYDLTGNTLYSDARLAIIEALASLERTVEG